MVEELDHSQRMQVLLYGLLTPLALLALVVWLLDEPVLDLLILLFCAYSAALLIWLPLEPGTNVGGLAWAVGLFVAFVVAGLVWSGVSQTVVVLVLLLLSLLRLWYLRQYHLKLDRPAMKELMRRCLLISMWSHVSVLAALINPYG